MPKLRLKQVLILLLFLFILLPINSASAEHDYCTPDSDEKPCNSYYHGDLFCQDLEGGGHSCEPIVSSESGDREDEGLGVECVQPEDYHQYGGTCEGVNYGEDQLVYVHPVVNRDCEISSYECRAVNSDPGPNKPSQSRLGDSGCDPNSGVDPDKWKYVGDDCSSSNLNQRGRHWICTLDGETIGFQFTNGEICEVDDTTSDKPDDVFEPDRQKADVSECNPDIDSPDPTSGWSFQGFGCDPDNPGTEGQRWYCKGKYLFASHKPSEKCEGVSKVGEGTPRTEQYCKEQYGPTQYECSSEGKCLAKTAGAFGEICAEYTKEVSVEICKRKNVCSENNPDLASRVEELIQKEVECRENAPHNYYCDSGVCVDKTKTFKNKVCGPDFVNVGLEKCLEVGKDCKKISDSSGFVPEDKQVYCKSQIPTQYSCKENICFQREGKWDGNKCTQTSDSETPKDNLSSCPKECNGSLQTDKPQGEQTQQFLAGKDLECKKKGGDPIFYCDAKVCVKKVKGFDPNRNECIDTFPEAKLGEIPEGSCLNNCQDNTVSSGLISKDIECKYQNQTEYFCEKEICVAKVWGTKDGQCKADFKLADKALSCGQNGCKGNTISSGNALPTELETPKSTVLNPSQSTLNTDQLVGKVCLYNQRCSGEEVKFQTCYGKYTKEDDKLQCKYIEGLECSVCLDKEPDLSINNKENKCELGKCIGVGPVCFRDEQCADTKPGAICNYPTTEGCNPGETRACRGELVEKPGNKTVCEYKDSGTGASCTACTSKAINLKNPENRCELENGKGVCRNAPGDVCTVDENCKYLEPRPQARGSSEGRGRSVINGYIYQATQVQECKEVKKEVDQAVENCFSSSWCDAGGGDIVNKAYETYTECVTKYVSKNTGEKYEPKDLQYIGDKAIQLSVAERAVQIEYQTLATRAIHANEEYLNNLLNENLTTQKEKELKAASEQAITDLAAFERGKVSGDKSIAAKLNNENIQSELEKRFEIQDLQSQIFNETAQASNQIANGDEGNALNTVLSVQNKVEALKQIDETRGKIAQSQVNAAMKGADQELRLRNASREYAASLWLYEDSIKGENSSDDFKSMALAQAAEISILNPEKGEQLKVRVEAAPVIIESGKLSEEYATLSNDNTIPSDEKNSRLANLWDRFAETNQNLAEVSPELAADTQKQFRATPFVARGNEFVGQRIRNVSSGQISDEGDQAYQDQFKSEIFDPLRAIDTDLADKLNTKFSQAYIAGSVLGEVNDLKRLSAKNPERYIETMEGALGRAEDKMRQLQQSGVDIDKDPQLTAINLQLSNAKQEVMPYIANKNAIADFNDDYQLAIEAYKNGDIGDIEVGNTKLKEIESKLSELSSDDPLRQVLERRLNSLRNAGPTLQKIAEGKQQAASIYGSVPDLTVGYQNVALREKFKDGLAQGRRKIDELKSLAHDLPPELEQKEIDEINKLQMNKLEGGSRGLVDLAEAAKKEREKIIGEAYGKGAQVLPSLVGNAIGGVKDLVLNNTPIGLLTKFIMSNPINTVGEAVTQGSPLYLAEKGIGGIRDVTSNYLPVQIGSFLGSEIVGQTKFTEGIIGGIFNAAGDALSLATTGKGNTNIPQDQKVEIALAKLNSGSSLYDAIGALGYDTNHPKFQLRLENALEDAKLKGSDPITWNLEQKMAFTEMFIRQDFNLPMWFGEILPLFTDAYSGKEKVAVADNICEKIYGPFCNKGKDIPGVTTLYDSRRFDEYFGKDNRYESEKQTLMQKYLPGIETVDLSDLRKYNDAVKISCGLGKTPFSNSSQVNTGCKEAIAATLGVSEQDLRAYEKTFDAYFYTAEKLRIDTYTGILRTENEVRLAEELGTIDQVNMLGAVLLPTIIGSSTLVGTGAVISGVDIFYDIPKLALNIARLPINGLKTLGSGVLDAGRFIIGNSSTSADDVVRIANGITVPPIERVINQSDEVRIVRDKINSLQAEIDRITDDPIAKAGKQAELDQLRNVDLPKAREGVIAQVIDPVIINDHDYKTLAGKLEAARQAEREAQEELQRLIDKPKPQGFHTTNQDYQARLDAQTKLDIEKKLAAERIEKEAANVAAAQKELDDQASRIRAQLLPSNDQGVKDATDALKEKSRAYKDAPSEQTRQEYYAAAEKYKRARRQAVLDSQETANRLLVEPVEQVKAEAAALKSRLDKAEIDLQTAFRRFNQLSPQEKLSELGRTIERELDQAFNKRSRDLSAYNEASKKLEDLTSSAGRNAIDLEKVKESFKEASDIVEEKRKEVTVARDSANNTAIRSSEDALKKAERELEELRIRRDELEALHQADQVGPEAIARMFDLETRAPGTPDITRELDNLYNLRSALIITRQNLEKSETAISKAIEDIKIRLQEKQELQKQFSDPAKKAQLEAEVRDLSTKLERGKTELAEIDQTLAAKEAELTTNQARLRALQDLGGGPGFGTPLFQDLTEEIAALNGRKTSLKNEIAGLEGELKPKQRDLINFSSNAIDNRNQEIENLKDNLNQLRKTKMDNIVAVRGLRTKQNAAEIKIANLSRAETTSANLYEPETLRKATAKLRTANQTVPAQLSDMSLPDLVREAKLAETQKGEAEAVLKAAQEGYENTQKNPIFRFFDWITGGNSKKTLDKASEVAENAKNNAASLRYQFTSFQIRLGQLDKRLMEIDPKYAEEVQNLKVQKGSDWERVLTEQTEKFKTPEGRGELINGIELADGTKIKLTEEEMRSIIKAGLIEGTDEFKAKFGVSTIDALSDKEKYMTALKGSASEFVDDTRNGKLFSLTEPEPLPILTGAESSVQVSLVSEKFNPAFLKHQAEQNPALQNLTEGQVVSVRFAIDPQTKTFKPVPTTDQFGQNSILVQFKKSGDGLIVDKVYVQNSTHLELRNVIDNAFKEYDPSLVDRSYIKNPNGLSRSITGSPNAKEAIKISEPPGGGVPARVALDKAENAVRQAEAKVIEAENELKAAKAKSEIFGTTEENRARVDAARRAEKNLEDAQKALEQSKRELESAKAKEETKVSEVIQKETRSQGFVDSLRRQAVKAWEDVKARFGLGDKKPTEKVPAAVKPPGVVEPAAPVVNVPEAVPAQVGPAEIPVKRSIPERVARGIGGSMGTGIAYIAVSSFVPDVFFLQEVATLLIAYKTNALWLGSAIRTFVPPLGRAIDGMFDRVGRYIYGKVPVESVKNISPDAARVIERVLNPGALDKVIPENPAVSQIINQIADLKLRISRGADGLKQIVKAVEDIPLPFGGFIDRRTGRVNGLLRGIVDESVADAKIYEEIAAKYSQVIDVRATINLANSKDALRIIEREAASAREAANSVESIASTLENLASKDKSLLEKAQAARESAKNAALAADEARKKLEVARAKVEELRLKQAEAPIDPEKARDAVRNNIPCTKAASRDDVIFNTLASANSNVLGAKGPCGPVEILALNVLKIDLPGPMDDIARGAASGLVTGIARGADNLLDDFKNWLGFSNAFDDINKKNPALITEADKKMLELLRNFENVNPGRYEKGLVNFHQADVRTVRERELAMAEAYIALDDKIKAGLVNPSVIGAEMVDTLEVKPELIKIPGRFEDIPGAVERELRQIEGRGLISAEERAVIESETGNYVGLYLQAFGGDVAKAYQVARDNARKLAYQAVRDKGVFSGSDHGTRHILEGNMKFAGQLIASLEEYGVRVSAKDKVLVHQIIIDHDLGYTVGAAQIEKGFEASKDHPLFSAKFLEANKAYYVDKFGEDGYEAIFDSVLNHSYPRLEYLSDGREVVHHDLIRSITSTVDSLGVTVETKTPEFFWKPEAMNILLKIRLAMETSLNGKVEPGLMTAYRSDLLSVAASESNPIRKAGYENAISSFFNEFTASTTLSHYTGVVRSVTVEPNNGSLRVVVQMSPSEAFAIMGDLFGDKDAVKAFAKALEDLGFDKPEQALIEFARARRRGEAFNPIELAHDQARMVLDNTSLEDQVRRGKAIDLPDYAKIRGVIAEFERLNSLSIRNEIRTVLANDGKLSAVEARQIQRRIFEMQDKRLVTELEASDIITQLDFMQSNNPDQVASAIKFFKTYTTAAERAYLKPISEVDLVAK